MAQKRARCVVCGDIIRFNKREKVIINSKGPQHLTCWKATKKKGMLTRRSEWKDWHKLLRKHGEAGYNDD